MSSIDEFICDQCNAWDDDLRDGICNYCIAWEGIHV